MNYIEEAKKLTKGTAYEISGKGRYAFVCRRGRLTSIYLFNSKVLAVTQWVAHSDGYIYDLELGEKL